MPGFFVKVILSLSEYTLGSFSLMTTGVALTALSGVVSYHAWRSSLLADIRSHGVRLTNSLVTRTEVIRGLNISVALWKKSISHNY